MKLLFVLIFCILLSCNGQRSDPDKALANCYKIVNKKGDVSTNRNYDIYILDTSKISEINEYLSNRFDEEDVGFIQINYYDDQTIAETFIEKQFSTSVSETEKNKLFSHYIASYRHNHATGYKKFSLMH